MRILNWDWKRANQIVTKNGQERARKAARVLAAAVRAKCPVGTMSRPIYRTGPHAGQPWTKRDAGALKKSVRVVERKEKYGLELVQFAGFRLIRVYIGNYYAYYAAIVEFYTPFIRPTAARLQEKIKSILENG